MDQLVTSRVDDTRLERGRDGQLRLTANGRTCRVRIRRCFPWSERNRFISLRDDEQTEVLLVEDPSVLDGDSRELLEDALIEADFVLEVAGIEKITEEIEIRCWQVRTAQGPRRFQTRRDEWPRVVPGGGILIRDVAGDLYYIRKPAELDPRSRKLLEIFVD